MLVDQITKHAQSPVLMLNPERYHAAWLDEHGRERPITEEMIMRACQSLEHESYSFLPSRQLISRQQTSL